LLIKLISSYIKTKPCEIHTVSQHILRNNKIEFLEFMRVVN